MLARTIPRSLMLSEDEYNPDQCVPAWTGFNAISMKDVPNRSTIGYCHVINTSPTDNSAVYTLMDALCKITRKI